MKGPVVIGGIGGSGTRVVANMLAEAGFYMGGHLNEAYDNLWFTLLFRRPHWAMKASDKEIEKAISIFDKAMNGSLGPSLSERLFIYKAEIDFVRRHYIKTKEWLSLPMAISGSLIHSRKIKLNNYQHWGWKEPNTHIFLLPLKTFYPHMKYIHVIRNGLDMAFSGNQLQLKNWGKWMGIKGNSERNNPERVSNPFGVNHSPVDSLEYWIKANDIAIQSASKLYASNFMLIHFEQLCSNPLEEVNRLFKFLEVTPNQDLINKLIKLPKLPLSTGRYKKENLSIYRNN